MIMHRHTNLLTPYGFEPIKSLVGKCKIWTGEEWSNVFVEKSSKEEMLYLVSFYAGTPFGDAGVWETIVGKDFYFFQCEDKSFKPLKKAIQHRSRCYAWESPMNNEKSYIKLQKVQEWHGSQTAYNVISDKPFVADCLILKNIHA